MFMTLRATTPAEEIRLFKVKQERLNVTLPANTVKKHTGTELTFTLTF
jgi:hypothetical protein